MNTLRMRRMCMCRKDICAILAALAFLAAGCAPAMPTSWELERFEKAGSSIVSGFELNEFLRAHVPVGAYRVVPGDLLWLEMPDVLRTIGGSGEGNDGSLRRRVRSDGTLRLPGMDEDLKVEQMTVAEVEEAVESAYEKHILNRPTCVVQVAEYDLVYVSVMGGGIVQPGQYMLRSDERSLSALLMKAGGIADPGASMIRVRPPGVGGPGPTLELPVRNETVPMDDVLLSGGEVVEVVPLAPAYLTIVGQVGSPGRYALDRAHPPTLIEALGFAGGVREHEDPRYVSIFRKNGKKTFLAARFSLHERTLWNEASMFHENRLSKDALTLVRPGDVLVVERTVRSRARQILARAFNVTTGFSGTVNATGAYQKDLQDGEYRTR